jgi:hypothetical protein
MITADEYNHSEHNSTITMPFLTNEERIRALVQDTIQKGGHQ